MDPTEDVRSEAEAAFSWNGVGVPAFGSAVVEDTISRTYKKMRHHVKQKGAVAKRMLVIDGMNALHCGLDPAETERKRELDCATLLPVIRFFVLRRHPVQLILPSFSLYDITGYFKQNWILKELKRLGILVSIRFKNHDDLIALRMAKENDGSVISRDNFRDHERIFPHLFDVSRRNIKLKFTKEGSDFFSNEKGEPFYKAQFEFLDLNPDALFSLNGDADFDYVKALKWDSSKRKSVIQGLDSILCMVEALAAQAEGRSLPESHILFGFERIPKSLHEFKSCLLIRAKRLKDEESEGANRKAVNMKPREPEELPSTAATAIADSRLDSLSLFAAVEALEHEFARKVIEEAWHSLPIGERTLGRLRNGCEERQLGRRFEAENRKLSTDLRVEDPWFFLQQGSPSVSKFLKEDQRLLRSQKEAFRLLGGAFSQKEILNAWNGTGPSERTGKRLRQVCMEFEERSHLSPSVTDKLGGWDFASTSGCQKVGIVADVSISLSKTGGAFMENEFTGRKVEKLYAQKDRAQPRRRKNGHYSSSKSNIVRWSSAWVRVPDLANAASKNQLAIVPHFPGDEQAELKEHIWNSIIEQNLDLDRDVLYEVLKTTQGDIDADTIVGLYFDHAEVLSVVAGQK